MTTQPTYRVARPSKRKRIVLQLLDVGLDDDGEVQTGGPVNIQDLRAYQVRYLVRLGNEECPRRSILLLRERAARAMLKAGSIHEIDLESFPPHSHGSPEAGTRTAEK